MGGLLVSLGGWRVQFYANLPIVVGALVLGWLAIPRTEAWSTHAKSRFDLLGSVLLFLFLGGVAALLSQSKSGFDWWLIGSGAAGLVLVLALFVWHERRYSDPVVNLGLFGHRAFASASSCIALSNLSMYVMLLAIPLLLAQRPGWTSDRTGLVLAVLFGATVLFSPVGGRLADRLGRRLPTTVGLALMSVGRGVAHGVGRAGELARIDKRAGAGGSGHRAFRRRPANLCYRVGRAERSRHGGRGLLNEPLFREHRGVKRAGRVTCFGE